MDISLSPDDEAFRQEVRAFLDAELTDDLREAGRLTSGIFTDKKWNMLWQKKLHAKGWVAPGWPKEYGGTGWTATQRHIFSAECARAGAPTLSPSNCGEAILARALGLVMLGTIDRAKAAAKIASLLVLSMLSWRSVAVADCLQR